jgi:octanoyl-[GcvH]:protein N-octanoyltransferase
MNAIFRNLNLGRETDIYYPFALEELLCREVGESEVPLSHMHIWRHERAFVLGLRDSRLPYAREAMDWLAREGFSVMVRNSGGAAVPLDPGVVNVTIIRQSERGMLGMYDDFRLMASLLQESLLPLGVRFDTGEVAGSYCPGDYDLSIEGRKFCGIAQRRQLKAYAVQAFVNVEGNSAERARLVQEFYARAGGSERVAGVLEVEAGALGSISELQTGFPGMEEWLTQLERAAATLQIVPTAESGQLSEIRYETAKIGAQAMIERMKARYDPRCAARI